MTNWSELSIGQIVDELPQASYIFRSAGIDFCCGGKQALGTVITAQGLSEDDIQAALDGLKERKPKQKDLDLEAMSPEDLASYIVSTHHAYLWDTLPRLRALLLTVLKAHGQQHPELYDIYKAYGELPQEMEPHLIREETELFPCLSEKDSSTDRKALIHILEEEHRATEETLKALRHASNDYSVPGDACENYKRLYQAFVELEKDTREHYHLEDDILFKKILA